MGRQKGAAERSKHKSASSSTFGLQNQGTQIFTGFGQEAIDPNVDPRLKVSLRKISKKDAITKTKACNELLGESLRIVETQAIFLNKCRKEADPTWDDSEFK